MRRGIITYMLVMLLATLTGCDGTKAVNDRARWVPTLLRDDKKPYGTYLAYASLKHHFPGAVIEPMSAGSRYSNADLDTNSHPGSRSLMILQGLDFYLSETEWWALKDFIKNGNEVVIFCRALDPKIQNELGYRVLADENEEAPISQASLHGANKDVLSLVSAPGKKYGYYGRTIRGYFAAGKRVKADTTGEENGEESEEDSTEYDEPIYGDTLGLADGKADFIRFGLGGGHLTLHAAPLVLSNYFLLQPGNTDYLAAMWHTLPAGIKKVYWSDYYKRSGETSGFSVLWRYPATRLALQLAMLVILLYLLFESKRKQRIIPVIAPLRNDSVSFVETVGRLYYNKGDHNNLAGKMTQQFLEWVRTHYFLNTNLLNETFTQQLIMKSGQQEAVVRGLMSMVHEIRSGTAAVDDAYLYQLYNTIQQFYKNDRS